MDKLSHYFPEFTPQQLDQLSLLESCLKDWNEKINLISRKDIENLRERHLVHSLAIARIFDLPAGTQVLDVGTGGGLPGLPLAIVFPRSRFLLVDSVGKKIRVVQDIISQLGLKNAEARQARAESLEGRFSFVTGRSVTSMERILSWTAHLLARNKSNSSRTIRRPVDNASVTHTSGGPGAAVDGGDREPGRLQPANGVIYFKGSQYSEELDALGIHPTGVYPLDTYFDGEFFQDKFVIHLSSESVFRAMPSRPVGSNRPSKSQ